MRPTDADPVALSESVAVTVSVIGPTGTVDALTVPLNVVDMDVSACPARPWTCACTLLIVYMDCSVPEAEKESPTTAPAVGEVIATVGPATWADEGQTSSARTSSQ